MIELDDSPDKCIGRGRHRLCFQHPKDSKRCIKIVHSYGTGGDKELRRELKYYKHLESYLKDWSGLPKYYGEVQTNLGTGYVYDKIVDFDGKISQTLSERFSSSNESDFQRKELVVIVNKLLRYLYDNRIVTMTLKPYNILCQRISETEIFPVICDNIGEASFIPIASHSAWFCHRKQRRIFQRFLHQPIINCLNLEKDGILIPQ